MIVFVDPHYAMETVISALDYVAVESLGVDHTPRAHRRAAARAGLTLVRRFDRAVGETVRGFYERAGRLDAYEQQCGLAVVLALAFVRA